MRQRERQKERDRKREVNTSRFMRTNREGSPLAQGGRMTSPSFPSSPNRNLLSFLKNSEKMTRCKEKYTRHDGCHATWCVEEFGDEFLDIRWICEDTFPCGSDTLEHSALVIKFPSLEKWQDVRHDFHNTKKRDQGVDEEKNQRNTIRSEDRERKRKREREGDREGERETETETERVRVWTWRVRKWVVKGSCRTR